MSQLDELIEIIHDATPPAEDGGVPDVCNRWADHKAVAKAILSAGWSRPVVQGDAHPVGATDATAAVGGAGVNDPLNPSATLLVKLGSAIVHAEEFWSPNGHVYDKMSFESIVGDPEVREWMAEMRKMAMLPVKRND